MTQREPLQSGPLAAMAEDIQANADVVMRTDALMKRVLIVGDAAFSSAYNTAMVHGRSVIVMASSPLADDLIIHQVPNCDWELMVRDVECFSNAAPPSCVSQQRRAVRAAEKARRKTMPRGKR